MPKKAEPAVEDMRGGKARAAKAAAAAEKSAAAERAREAAESAAWADGANTRKLERERAAAAAAAEKAEKKRIAEELAAKEAAEASKQKLRGAEKVAARKAQTADEHAGAHARAEAPALEARTIEQAIAVLTVSGGVSADGSGDVGAAHAETAAAAAAASKIAANLTGGPTKVDDRHPERRMKAAYKAFEERELPLLREEFPTLRRTQLNDMLFRKWQRSPENPMNAPHLAFNTKKSDAV